jgi:DNA repair photolyase
VDEQVWRSVEPGTPSPRRRLEVCAALNEAGIRCGVLMAPVLPFLTDSDAQIDATVRAVAASGATYVSPIPLHLRSGAREWWQAWLRREHPDLLGRYAELFGERAYAPKAYQAGVTARVRAAAARHGVGRGAARRAPTAGAGTASVSATDPPAPSAAQLALL